MSIAMKANDRLNYFWNANCAVIKSGKSKDYGRKQSVVLVCNTHPLFNPTKLGRIRISVNITFLSGCCAKWTFLPGVNPI